MLVAGIREYGFDAVAVIIFIGVFAVSSGVGYLLLWWVIDRKRHERTR